MSELHTHPLQIVYQRPSVRRFLAQRQIAVSICATALLLTLLLPTGYMVATSIVL